MMIITQHREDLDDSGWPKDEDDSGDIEIDRDMQIRLSVGNFLFSLLVHPKFNLHFAFFVDRPEFSTARHLRTLNSQ